MKVPSSFEMYATTVRVVERSQDAFDTNCTYGDWCAADAEISLRKGLSKDAALMTFAHEFTHAQLEAAGRADLSTDEKLVETLGGLLAQMLKSAK